MTAGWVDCDTLYRTLSAFFGVSGKGHWTRSRGDAEEDAEHTNDLRSPRLPPRLRDSASDLLASHCAQVHGGHPLSKTIFHFPLASRRQIELKVPMRLWSGSQTGPELSARVPESSTSTCSGSQENGALGPS